MLINNCTIEDFYEIKKNIVNFWGSDRTLYLHYQFLVYEFGNTSFVIKEKDKIIAYLFGFFSQTEKLGYIHLIVVRKDYQKKGLGEILYKKFIEICKLNGIKKIKAITRATNIKSINFHRDKIGMTLLGSPNEEGINTVKNYSGENEDRVVFEMYL